MGFPYLNVMITYLIISPFLLWHLGKLKGKFKFEHSYNKSVGIFVFLKLLYD